MTGVRTKGLSRIAAMSCLVLFGADQADAVTLADVIATVRGSNPEIAAQKAQVSADIAQVAIARAPARPRVQGSGVFTQGTDGANVSSGFDRTFDGSVLASLPVYDGGEVHQEVVAQRLRVVGSKADAEATDQRVVLDAISAYLDVLRDREIVALSEENLRLLNRDLEANRRRFSEGDVTRTDIALTEARQSGATSRLESARIQLGVSEENYRRLVGSAPEQLAPAPPLPLLSSDPDVVADKAIDIDPRVEAARADAEAARVAVRAARATSKPTLSVTGGGEYHNYSRSPVGYPNEVGFGGEVTGTLSYPIYQGGLVGAKIAQARAAANKAGFSREIASRAVAAEARTASIRYAASLRTIAEDEKAVSLERDALTGAQTEAKGGERSVIDVLNADRELLDTQIILVNAEHDSYVAGVRLMNALGFLDCLEQPSPECAA